MYLIEELKEGKTERFPYLIICKTKLQNTYLQGCRDAIHRALQELKNGHLAMYRVHELQIRASLLGSLHALNLLIAPSGKSLHSTLTSILKKPTQHIQLANVIGIVFNK